MAVAKLDLLHLRLNASDDTQIDAIADSVDKEVWESSLNRFDLPWINLYGGKEFQNELFKKYRGGGIPLTVLIGKDGKIERYNDIRASFNLKEIISDLEFAF